MAMGGCTCIVLYFILLYSYEMRYVPFFVLSHVNTNHQLLSISIASTRVNGIGSLLLSSLISSCFQIQLSLILRFQAVFFLVRTSCTTSFTWRQGNGREILKCYWVVIF